MNQAEKRTVMAFAAICTVLTLAYIHGLNWGRWASSIPTMKLAQMTGTASAETLENIVQACREQAKYDCAQQAYVDLYKKTQNPEVVARLGDMQAKLGDTKTALSTYAAYIQVGGKDPKRMYEFGQLQEKSGDAQAAIDTYAKAVQASTDRLPVRAMTALVRLLMVEHRYQDALTEIKAFHDSAGNAEGYFLEEESQLPKLIRESKKVAAR
jgi:tetratricopeptide (TPR) repeat protein